MQFENSYSRPRRGSLAKAGMAALLALALLALMASSAAATPTFSLSIKNSEGGATPLTGTRTITTDSSGNVYTVNGNTVVQKFSSSGKYLSKFTLATGCAPNGMDGDSSGNIWVSCRAINKVIKYSSTGTVLQEIGTPTGFQPLGVAADSTSNVWFQIGESIGSAWKKDSSGNTKAIISPTTGGLGIEVDPSNNVWIIYPFLSTPMMKEYNSNGEFIREWSSPSGYGMASDASGNIWIQTSTEVKKYSPLGVQLDKFGSGKLTAPAERDGVAIGPEGAIWVANNAGGGGEIQKWIP